MIAFDLIFAPAFLSGGNDDISVPSRCLETTRSSTQQLFQVALLPAHIQ